MKLMMNSLIKNYSTCLG